MKEENRVLIQINRGDRLRYNKETIICLQIIFKSSLNHSCLSWGMQEPVNQVWMVLKIKDLLNHKI